MQSFCKACYYYSPWEFIPARILPSGRRRTAAIINPCSYRKGKGRRPEGGTAHEQIRVSRCCDAQIDDEARTAVLDNCKALVEKFGGTITNVDDWGKKKLAYEIQKMNEGYYTFIQFDAEGSAIAEIEQRMRIMDNVIRYLCVKQNEA